MTVRYSNLWARFAQAEQVFGRWREFLAELIRSAGEVDQSLVKQQALLKRRGEPWEKRALSWLSPRSTGWRNLFTTPRKTTHASRHWGIRSAWLRFEQLEDRRLLAVLSDNGSGTLTISLGVNENFAITTIGTSDAFTSNQAIINGGVSNTGDFSAFGSTSISLQASGISRYNTLINITDSNGASGNTTVTFKDSAGATYSNNIAVALSNTSAGQISFNGSSNFGTHNIQVTTVRNIVVNTTASISTTSGNLSFSANEQAAPTSGFFSGIEVFGPIQSTGTGQLTLNGRGGDGNGLNAGVWLSLSGKIVGGTAGTLSVNGTGGSSTFESGTSIHQNAGVLLFSPTSISSAGSNVQVTGVGISTTGTAQVDNGVELDTGAQISAGGMGNVLVQGSGVQGVFLNGSSSAGCSISSNGGNVQVIGIATGAIGASESCQGVSMGNSTISAAGMGTVAVQGTGSSINAPDCFGVGMVENPGTSICSITSSGGNVSVTGQGGGTAAGFNNYGVYLSGANASNDFISAGGGGTVTVQGTGGLGSSSPAVMVIAGTITSGGGDVKITGLGPDGGIFLLSNGTGSITTAANGGNLTFITNHLSLSNTVSTNSNSSVTIEPYTSGLGINLGNGSVPPGQPLFIFNPDLGHITTGTLNIGNSSAGTIFASNVITAPAGWNLLNLITGANVSQTFTGTGLTVSNLNIIAPTGIGSASQPLIVAGVNSLTTDSSASNGNQFLRTFNTASITSLNAGTGTIDLKGGTFNLTGANQINANTTLQIDSGTFGIDTNNQTVAQLIINGGTASGSTGILTSTAAIDGRSGVASAILGGTSGLIKTGAGTLTLSGINAYSGATNIGTGSTSGGTLVINGSVGSNVTVGFDSAHVGTLAGNGTVNGTVTVNNGSTLAPGNNSPGILNTGDLSFADGSKFNIQIGGTTAGTASNQYDQVNVTGGVSIGNGVALNLSAFSGFVPNASNIFVPLSNDNSDAVSGSFNNLPEGATITDFLSPGLTSTISYVGGSNSNDVTIDFRINNAPQGANNTIEAIEDTPYVFSTADFGFSDPNDSPADNFAGVVITTSPTAGTLTDNNIAVTNGQFISLADVTSGQLVFTPAANVTGAGYAGFTFQVQDDGGTANGGANLDPIPRSMIIDLTSVNDAPQGADNAVTTLEDSSYVFSTADFGFNDPNDAPPNNLAAVEITTLPTAGTLTDNNVPVTLGQFVPVADISANLLEFTPVANANGGGYASFTFQVQDDGGTANGGVDVDPTPRTMTVNVTSVNDAPQGASNAVTTLEDSSYFFSTADFGFNDPNDTPPNNLAAVKITTIPAAGSLTDNNVPVTTGQFVPVADISANLLKFTPAANANGAGYASFTFQVQDDGGTANGGVNLDPTPRSMAVNVMSVNDAPQGTSNAVTTLEDTAFVFSTAAFGFSDPNDSPANNFAAVKITTIPTAGTLTDNNVAVTTGQFVPVADISANLLKFTPAANANGTGYSSFTFQVQDDGGTANSGVNLDPTPRSMTVNVTSVNDVPVFAAGSNETVNVNAGLQSFPNWATGISAGPPDESGQTLNFLVTNTNSSLFSSQPSISSTGTLTFTPAANATGSATVMVQLHDNGGTANLGVDTSAVQSFTITVQAAPPPTSGLFDFDATSGPATTAAGYNSVLGTTLYTPSLGYGWVTTAAASFDRLTTNLLLRDGNYGGPGAAGARTFQENLANGNYLVNVTMGDAGYGRDSMQVKNADTGAILLANVNTGVNQFYQADIPVSVSDGSLDLQFSDQGGDPYWVVNSMEIRPVTTFIPVTFTAGPGAVASDGLSTDTISGTAAVPNGTLLTISSTLGTIVTDSSSQYLGNQVVVNGGTFSFQMVRSAAGGTPTLSATAVDGSALGSTTNPAVLSYQIAATRRFDFNATSNVTATGFIGVRGANLYAANTGYGWNLAAGEFDRTTASATTTALYRDGNYGSTGTAGARTFEVQVTPGATYGIRVYIGDTSYARDDIQVTAEGGGSAFVPLIGANQFTSVTLTGVDTNNDGILNVTIQDTGGSDGYWVINGMDVSAGGVGSLPGGAPLQVIGTGPGGTSAGAALTSQALAPIVQEAIARWQATGISSQAVAMLQNVKFQITNLDGQSELGLATPGQVQIDDNGDGYGWFVDPTPNTDVEFATSVATTELQATAGSAAYGHMDLLTVVMHELGHELGLTDLSTVTAPHSLMTESITTGIRRLPPMMTSAIATATTAAPQPLMVAASASASVHSVASDSVFASLAGANHSGALDSMPCAPTQSGAAPAPNNPLRMETASSISQTTLISTAHSVTTSSAAARKMPSTVDAVFSLLGR